MIGNFRVIDALATLAFDFPRRPQATAAPFFRGELEQFAALARASGCDPLSVQGSYAGAIGHAAVHAEQHHAATRSTSTATAASTCRQRRRRDRQRRQLPGATSAGSAACRRTSTCGRADRRGRPRARCSRPTSCRPSAPASSSSAAPGCADGGAARRAAGAGRAAERRRRRRATWPARRNFYAMTRYNWSSYYAMAVIELGAAVAAAR